MTLRKDEEGLTDVVALEHDIGLVRTKRHMHLPMMMPTLDVLLHEIYQIDPQNLLGQMLTVSTTLCISSTSSCFLLVLYGNLVYLKYYYRHGCNPKKE